jgi:hypothetical protein
MHTHEIEVDPRPEIDQLVVSRLVRGLILRHRAGRLVHSCAGLFQAVSPRLSTGSPWTGRIAAGGPAK